MNFSIGIINFNKRFEECLVPLINQIKSGYKDIEIIVSVNCNYNEPFDQNYRRRVLEFLAGHDHTYPIFHPDFRGCSHHWNTLSLNATKDNLLFLSDDTGIRTISFLDRIASEIDNRNGDSFLINNSCSSWLINRNQLRDLGWFDERLLGFGEEDGDFFYRYYEKYGRMPRSIGVHEIYDKQMDSSSDKIKKGIGKYTDFNRKFIYTKYIPGQSGIQVRYTVPHIRSGQYSDEKQYPYDGFFRENIVKLGI